MQRIINDPNLVVEDMLKGFVKAHSDIVVATSNPRVLKYKDAPVKDKVGIVTGGGSGHKPAFIGYIGKNLWMQWQLARFSLRRQLRLFMTHLRKRMPAKG